MNIGFDKIMEERKMLSFFKFFQSSDLSSECMVLCLVRENQTIFSGGYSKLAREYPLMVGDKCTFKLIKPFEFVLFTSKKTREDIDHYMID